MSASTRAPEVVIAMRAVRKAFRGKEVLRGVDLEIRRGEAFTILGGSGSGKSVCLKHVIGLLRPDSGRIVVLGHEVARLSETELVAVRKRCAMVFQGAALFDSLTVYENVAYPLREHLRLAESELAGRVARCLAAVGLQGIEALVPAELSGGMRKRVAVARAIALEPEVILYDEPTTGLDPANSRRIGKLIVELKERLRVTSVVVTHDLELCFEISDQVALLKDGRILVQGTPAEMRVSTHPGLRAFLEGAQEEEPARPGAAEGRAHGA